MAFNDHLKVNQQALTTPSIETLSAVVLAGGKGSRVGFQQKALLSYQGQPLLVSILETLATQCHSVWVNVNAEQARYQVYSHALFSDNYQGFLGPLAGMHAAWRWLEEDWALFVPCDNPHLPKDFASRLIQAYRQKPAPLVVAFDGERIQPLYLLMHRSMVDSLSKAIEMSHLSVYRWIEENDFTRADFSDCAPLAFQNLNSLESFK